MMMRPTALALGLSWLACLVVGVAVGMELGRWPLRTQLADLRTTHAETARLAALASAKTLQAAQTRGDALTTQLAQRQVQIDQLAQDKRDAIHRLTTGRACLSGAAVRMLNQPDDPADYGFDPVPPPPGSPVADPATFATDADVGSWAIAARAQYDTCRARLAALIDWHTAPAAQQQHPREP